MVIFLYGPDSYRRNEKLKELVDKYKEKYRERADFVVFDLEEDADSWKSVLDFLTQPSMFIESKVAVVKNPTLVNKKEWLEGLKKALDAEKLFLLLSEDTKKPKKDFSFLLKKPANYQLFEELAGNDLLAFIKKESEKRKVELEKEALSLFVSYVTTVKNRSAVVVNELEKISLAGFSRPARINDLNGIINWAVQEAMYVTAGRLLQTKNQKGRLIVLNQLLTRNEDPGYVFNMAAFRAKGRAVVGFADADVAVKSGKLDYENALLGLCL